MLKDVTGIVLKERDYGNSSKILDVFTKEYGLIGIISKGSKKMKSNLSGVSTRLTYGIFHIYYKEDKLSTLNGVDVITLAGGIGETGFEERERICNYLECFGIKLDLEKNKIRGEEAEISSEDSKVKIYIVPTNEEIVIATDAYELTK